MANKGYQVHFIEESTVLITGVLAADRLAEIRARVLRESAEHILSTRLLAPAAGSTTPENSEQDIVEGCVAAVLSEVLTNEALLLVTEPGLEFSRTVEGDISYELTLTIYPQPEVYGYQQIRVEISKQSVTEDDIEERLQFLRSSRSITTEVTGVRAVEPGDEVGMTLLVEIDGQLEGDDTEILRLRLGQGILPDEVEQELHGMEAGDQKSVSVKAPREFPEPLVGIYTIRIVHIYENETPSLTDEFVASLELGVSSIESLKKLVFEEEEEQRANEEYELVTCEIWKKLFHKNNFQIPNQWIDEEIRALIIESGEATSRESQHLSLDGYYAKFGQLADERLRKKIIVERLAEQEQHLSPSGENSPLSGDALGKGPQVSEELISWAESFLVSNTRVVYSS